MEWTENTSKSYLGSTEQLAEEARANDSGKESAWEGAGGGRISSEKDKQDDTLKFLHNEATFYTTQQCIEKVGT